MSGKWEAQSLNGMEYARKEKLLLLGWTLEGFIKKWEIGKLGLAGRAELW